MSRSIPGLLLLGALLPASSALWADNNDAVYSLAQGCFAVQSPHTDNYMQRYQSGGTVNSGWSFNFKADTLEEATSFYMKPSGMGSYILRDVGGHYLDTRFPAEITAGNVLGKHADWQVNARHVNNEYHYRFNSKSLNKWLRHNWSSQGIYFIDLLNPSFRDSEEWFRLVPKDDCVEFPEAEINIAGDETVLKGNADLPVRGSIDPHTHITSYEFMGGTMMGGAPFHPYGVSKALADSSDIHGSWGHLDVIGNLMGFDDIGFRYDTRGWPDFPFWPHYKSLSHTGYYYRWIERAFQGGQRMMVTHLVENEVLCNMQSTLLPQSWGGTNNCNTMDSVDLQILRLHEMQTYIDAQAGGPGKGFFRLVQSPAEARDVIADGKMAVVVGMEVSEMFNCGLKDATCSEAWVEQQLQKYHDLGVRALYPIHRFDNQFGGTRIENGLINIGNHIATGRYFATETCDADTQGQMMTNDPGLFGLEAILGVTENPHYDETTQQCNTRGLTDLGIFLVNRMMDLGMMIEVDHMSKPSHEAVLDIAEARQYSGVVSGHSHMHSGANGSVHANSIRVAELGGILAPYNADATSIAGALSGYLDVVEQTPYVNGVPFSTDMSGMGIQGAPRANADTNPLQYPFTTEFGLTVDQQVSGNRTFDLNTDGMAHYGLVADHIQDIREQASARVYESLMNSAEAYLQMWERSVANEDKRYINPLAPTVTIYNRGSGTCLDIPDNDNGVHADAWVGLYACQQLSRDQRWQYNPDTGTLANNMHGGEFCLDNSGTPWNNGYPTLQQCNDGDQQKWSYIGQRIQNSGSVNHSLDAYGNGWAGFWESHSDDNQKWELRLDSASGRWAEYRSVASGQCVTVANVANPNGSELSLASCDGSDQQQWLWNPTAGTLASGLDNNLCAKAATSSISNDTPMILGTCGTASEQVFERHADSSFRLKSANGYAMDAAGDRVILYQHHGNDNQRWVATMQ